MNQKISFLERKAYNMRVNCLRATTQAGSGHLTSCLSAADIMSVLFFDVMRYDAQDVFNPHNDCFVLSKGHAAPLLYAAWKEVGVISDEEFMTLRQFDSVLEGHPTPRFPYVDVATGSLGMGLSIGLGKALAARLDGYSPYFYVLMGDAETSEGSVWEAAEVASFYRSSNLIAIVDVNRLGQSTTSIDGHAVEKYRKKFEAFGWKAWIVDGHDIASLIEVFNKAHQSVDQPAVIIAKTYKGYGLDAEIEDKQGFHGKAFAPERLPALLDSLKKKFPQAATYQESTELELKEKVEFTTKNKELSPKSLKAFYKKGEDIPTRKVFGESLATWGKEYPEIVSLDADVKNSTFAEIFEKAFPERFFQCFVAEQNMISMGVGFATRGKIPFISTFSCFLTRAFDQLRMAAIGRAPLRIVGSHAGVSVGEDGPSQMGLEDIALMRTLPQSIVLHPCDAVSTFYLIQQMIEYTQGISYLRTLREATPVIYSNDHHFEIGGCTVLKQSDQDVACIIAVGITVFEALKAYDLLAHENIFVSVVDCYSIKPLPQEQLQAIIRRSGKKALIIEDHYMQGGLSEALTGGLCNAGFLFFSFGIAVPPLPHSGRAAQLRSLYGIDGVSIQNRVRELLRC
jgi:transketolase